MPKIELPGLIAHNSEHESIEMSYVILTEENGERFKLYSNGTMVKIIDEEQLNA